MDKYYPNEIKYADDFDRNVAYTMPSNKVYVVRHNGSNEIVKVCSQYHTADWYVRERSVMAGVEAYYISEHYLD